jgi:hypothetical protein
MKKIMIAVPTSWSEIDKTSQIQTLINMREGGSFACRIAEAFEVADVGNTEKLATAFAHLIDRFKPESATQYHEATCENIGYFEVEDSHRDDYLRIICSKEVTAEQIKVSLHKAFQHLAAIGPYRGFSVHVREGIDEGEFIGIVRKTYYL